MAGENPITSRLGIPIIPAAEPVDLGNGRSRVNLKRPIRINGVKFDKGEGVEVPTDAHEVWKHALADGN